MSGLVQLPLRPRSCFDCVHFSEARSTCELFAEVIDSELFAAADCEGYEP